MKKNIYALGLPEHSWFVFKYFILTKFWTTCSYLFVNYFAIRFDKMFFMFSNWQKCETWMNKPRLPVKQSVGILFLVVWYVNKSSELYRDNRTSMSSIIYRFFVMILAYVGWTKVIVPQNIQNFHSRMNRIHPNEISIPNFSENKDL